MFGLPKHSKAFTSWIDLIDLHINRISEFVLFHSKPLCTSYSFGKKILEFSPLQFFQKIFLLIFAIWTGKMSPDHERRRQTSSRERGCRRPDVGIVAQTQALSPGRRHHRPSAEVWGVCEKSPLPRGRRRRTGANVVAQKQASSPGRKRRRPSAEVWGVCEKIPLTYSTRRCTGACVVACAHTFLPGRMRCRPGVDVVARADTLLPRCRRLWSPDHACAQPQALSPGPVPSALKLHRV